MGLSFAVGSLCFIVAPLSLYGHAVGGPADAITYFVGSVPFTLGGALQTWLSLGERRGSIEQRALWWAAVIQFLGTVYFNLTTLRGIDLGPQNHHYDRLVWRPDAIGSACFLVSGVVLYLASPRENWRPRRSGPGWWEPGLNLLGCVFFAIAAIAAFAQPRTGSLLGPRIDGWTTSLGAVCFFACAAATLASGRTVKSLRLRQVELDLERTLLGRILGHHQRTPGPISARSDP